MSSKPFQNTFDVSLTGGDTIHVKRHFDFVEGSIDLDITFKPSDRLSMSMLDIHIASLDIAMHHLRQLLDRAKASKSEGPTHPAG